MIEVVALAGAINSISGAITSSIQAGRNLSQLAPQVAKLGALDSQIQAAEAGKHKGILSMFEKVTKEEIIPHVDPLPDLSPSDYYQLILNRFSNPEIKDTVRRVAFDGSSRHSIFIVPSINDSIAKDMSYKGLALVEALWAKMCQGIREDKSKIENS